MKPSKLEHFADILTAVAVGLILTALALQYFDVLI